MVHEGIKNGASNPELHGNWGHIGILEGIVAKIVVVNSLQDCASN